MTLHLPHHDSCSFCEYIGDARPCVFVARGTVASAFVNPTQYERGALLVVPNEHAVSILEASPAQVAAVAQLVQTVSHGLDLAFQPTGLNVFQNNGLPSGQHVPHYHVHVVPRYGEAEPMKLFRARDFRFQPPEELEPIATEIRRALATFEARAV